MLPPNGETMNQDEEKVSGIKRKDIWEDGEANRFMVTGLADPSSGC